VWIGTSHLSDFEFLCLPLFFYFPREWCSSELHMMREVILGLFLSRISPAEDRLSTKPFVLDTVDIPKN